MYESLSGYMQRSLFDPEEGFYEKEQISDHFCTPSTLASDYHQWLEGWIRSKNFDDMIEYGCGEGQMATFLAPHFSRYQIIEKSLKQQKRLAHLTPYFRQSPVIADSTFILCQEVFDTFCVDMFLWKGGCLYEWKRDPIQKVLIAEQSENQNIRDYLKILGTYDENLLLERDFSCVDYSLHKQFLRDLFFQMRGRSELLIIDYGWQWTHLRASLDTDCPLRGFYHSQVIAEPWSDQRCMDLTYSIDFSYLAFIWEDLGGQVNFLKPLSRFLIEDVQVCIPLSRADRMLFHPLLMGSQFLVLSLSV